MAGIAMLLLCSCDAENKISTKYPCQFYFKSQYHPGTSLESDPQRNGRLHDG